MERIYLDNASTTPLHPEVCDLMHKLMLEEFGNPSSIHQHGRKSKAIIENARKTVAKILNVSISEVFFTGSATESNNMALKMSVLHLNVKRIITSPTEHHCVLHTVEYLQKHFQTEVLFLEVDEFGNPNLEQLDMLLNDRSQKTLVSIMHGNNEIGTMVNLEKLSDICKKHDTLLHCDAVQTVGKYSIDVQNTPLSFLSGSAHKFHGPKGCGFIYISNENIIPPFIHGGAQERNMRAGTENVYGIAGLAKALELSYENLNEVRHKNETLRYLLKNKLSEIFLDIQFNGNQKSNYLSHVLSVSFPDGPKADLLVFNLDISGISASSASACSAGIEEDSHVLKAIGHDAKRKTIRFSFSNINTEQDILMTIEKLKSMTPLK